jgi:formiminotetrahydrofolate cyclodeaminase
MEKYIDQPMKIYVDDLAAHKDAPGGGSACGLVGALAAALGSMVCHFTIGKKKYADVEERIREMLQEFEASREKLTGLMQEDVDVFHLKMGTAFSLPKDTDEQKAIRNAAIQDACKVACQPPMEIARFCFRLMKLLDELADKGSSQLVSDVGVAASIAGGAFDGARFNVEINLKYLNDEEFINHIQEELFPLIYNFLELQTNVIQKVREKMRN